MHVLCSCAKQTQKGRTAERYTKHTQKGKKPWSTAEKDSDVEETASGNKLQQEEEYAQSSVVVQKKRRKAVTKKPWSTAEKDSDVEEMASGNKLQQNDEDAQSSVVVQNKRRKAVTKKPWSTAEKDFVRMHFAEFILNKRLPEKSSIEQFLAESKLNRSWKNVKDHIRNQCILQQGDNAFGRCLWK